MAAQCIVRWPLKEIRDKFDDAAIELICDLDNSEQADQPRIQALEKQQSDLLKEVVKNENEVNEKIKKLLTAQPMSELEKETLELKRKQMSTEDEEKKKEAEKRKNEEGNFRVGVSNVKPNFAHLLKGSSVQNCYFGNFLWGSFLQRLPHQVHQLFV